VRLVLASGNAGKLAELRELLGDRFTLHAQSEFGLGDADETGLSFIENAILKARHAARATGLPALGDDSDLYSAGLTSHATVGLMLAIEDEFDVEFPDRLLRRRTFYSVNSLAEALAEICGQTDPV
jgi:acyl carrier protein